MNCEFSADGQCHLLRPMREITTLERRKSELLRLFKRTNDPVEVGTLGDELQSIEDILNQKVQELGNMPSCSHCTVKV